MKIGFVCNEYPPSRHGGIGTMTQILSRALVRAGHEVRVAGVYGDVSRATVDVVDGVEVHRLPEAKGRFQWVASRRRLYARMRAWAKAGAVDIIELPDWQGWAAGWPRLPVPVVARLNGSATYFDAEMGRPTPFITKFLETRSIRRVDYWCSVSHYTAQKTQALFELPTPAAAILPNPVAVPPQTEWSRRQTGKVVFSGTLTEKKGVVPLIEAWRDVISVCPTARLHMLGKDGTAPGGGSMTTFLRKRLGTAVDTVVFHGHVVRETVLQNLSEAAIAVFPSFAEAFAIAPLEAMAAGCPTIGSALGSGPELIADGLDGLTVDPNRPEQITRALVDLLDNPPRARLLADAGYRKVSTQFSLDHLLTANVRFYESCVAGFAKGVTTTGAAAAFVAPRPTSAKVQPMTPRGKAHAAMPARTEQVEGRQ